MYVPADERGNHHEGYCYLYRSGKACFPDSWCGSTREGCPQETVEAGPNDAFLSICRLIGMETCGSAHYWANKLQGVGYTVKLMASLFVKPYVKTNKNDAADAEVICEAVTRPVDLGNNAPITWIPVSLDYYGSPLCDVLPS